MTLAASLPGWRPCRAHGWIRWDSPSGMVQIRTRGASVAVVRFQRDRFGTARHYTRYLGTDTDRAIQLALRAERLLPRWACASP